MNKFTLLTLKEEKYNILEKLQSFENVQFINLNDSLIKQKNSVIKGLKSQENLYEGYAEKLKLAEEAINILRKYVPRKTYLKRLRLDKKEITLEDLEDLVNGSSFEEISLKIKEKDQLISNLEIEEKALLKGNEELSPFQSMDVKIEEFNKVRLPKFMGSIPIKYKDTFYQKCDDFYFEDIFEDNQNLYFLIISDNDSVGSIKDFLAKCEFSEVSLDIEDRPINVVHTNSGRISKIDSEIFFAKEELASLEDEYKMFELVVEYYNDIKIRKKAAENFVNTEKIDVICGWVPFKDNENLNNLIKLVVHDKYYLEFEDMQPEEADSVPVKLENSKINSAFEGITKRFGVPKYDDIDPTPILAPFYLLFFGMMVADIGYGLLVLGISIVILKIFKLDDKTKKFFEFFKYLSFTIIGFGFIYGSLFGFQIPIPGHLSMTRDLYTSLIVSVVFGVVQIVIGIGIKLYEFKKAGKLELKNIKMENFKMINHPKVILTALSTLFSATRIITDIASYARLMIIGLACGVVATSINMIIGMIPGMAIIVLGPIIFIIGHLFNLSLSLINAYIHGCRLQYTEFFGKFYDGGGNEFIPFASKKEYIKLKKY